MIATASRIL